jgi:hypothetical protein
LNISFIFITLFVLNEDKSIDSKEEHLLYILLIFITLFALNEDKSIDSKEEHSQNIKEVDVNNLLNLNLILICPISLFSYL